MRPGIPSLLLGGAFALITTAPFLLRYPSGNGRQSSPFSAGRVGHQASAQPVVEGFAEEWLRLINSGGKDSALRAAACADTLDSSECRAAAEYALKIEPTGKMLLSVISRWAELSGAQAMRWVMDHATVAGHDELAKEVAAGWAAANSGELESWLEAESDQVRSKLGAFTAELMLKTDPAAAIRLAQKFDLAFDKRTFAQCVKNAESAQRILIQLKASAGNSEKGLELGRYCRELWAYNDPAGCIKWEEVNGTFSESPFGAADYYVDTILQAKDIPQGAESVCSIVEPEKLSDTLRTLIQRWAPGSPEAAGAWLNTRPNTPDRWSAAAEYAVLCAETDMDAAWQWVATVGKESQREKAERQILLKWAETDPISAETRLMESGWPETRIQEMRERMAVVERAK